MVKVVLSCALVLALAACSGARDSHHVVTSTARPAATADPTRVDPILARLGLPQLPGTSPLPGYLMIADRDNNRIIIVNPAGRIVWRFPGGGPGFPGPDDAFVSPDGRYISVNQEFNETIALVSLSRRPRLVWSYGHAAGEGSASGYLGHPDDAYLLPNGEMQVADILNCRVL